MHRMRDPLFTLDLAALRVDLSSLRVLARDGARVDVVEALERYLRALDERPLPIPGGAGSPDRALRALLESHKQTARVILDWLGPASSRRSTQTTRR